MRAKVKEEKWQGKRICNRGEDVHFEQGDCFAWLSCWKAPTQQPRMWLLVYKNFTESYFQQRYSVIIWWGQVAVESKGVEYVEWQQRLSHISQLNVGISPDVVFGKAQQRS